MGERERAAAGHRVEADPVPREPEPPGHLAAVLALQRAAGNHATAMLLRDAKQVAVTDVSLSASKASVPADGAITARPVPRKATGVTFSVEKNTVEPAGVTVDAATGAVTVADTQEAGIVNIRAESDDGSWALAPLIISEKPATLDATSATATSTGKRYGGEFVHTFSGKSGDATKMEGANVNERFDALKVQSPFGSFDLKANGAGSRGWDLDASGAMTGTDNVSIDKSMVDARRFVASASNPSPAAALPQDFTMTQKLHAKGFPSGRLDGAPFTTAPHTRALKDDAGTLSVVITAGLESVTFDYEGKPVYTNAKASATTVAASPPKPKAKGQSWDRGEVTVTADVRPASAKLVFSLVGPKLGCEIDKETGVVTIGDKPGKINVRASDGTAAHYDEVEIEITA